MGGEDEIGDTDAGPAPEGAELKLSPPNRKSAGSLDLAAANDEPTQLIRMLIVAAREHVGESEHNAEWKALLGHFEKADKEIARMQDPSHKRANHGTL